MWKSGYFVLLYRIFFFCYCFLASRSVGYEPRWKLVEKYGVVSDVVPFVPFCLLCRSWWETKFVGLNVVNVGVLWWETYDQFFLVLGNLLWMSQKKNEGMEEYHHRLISLIWVVLTWATISYSHVSLCTNLLLYVLLWVGQNYGFWATVLLNSRSNFEVLSSSNLLSGENIAN